MDLGSNGRLGCMTHCTSANSDGPGGAVSKLTERPTCTAHKKLLDGGSASRAANGWAKSKAATVPHRGCAARSSATPLRRVRT